MLAVLVRSDLDIPGQIAKFLSLYLLFAIGFKGGVALAESELDSTVWLTLSTAILLSALVPLYCFVLLKRRLSVADAAATAACAVGTNWRAIPAIQSSSSRQRRRQW